MYLIDLQHVCDISICQSINCIHLFWALITCYEHKTINRLMDARLDLPVLSCVKNIHLFADKTHLFRILMKRLCYERYVMLCYGRYVRVIQFRGFGPTDRQQTTNAVLFHVMTK